MSARISGVCAAAVVLLCCGWIWAEQPSSAVELYDTLRPSAAALAPDALRTKTGWRKLEEDQAAHQFKGDAVLTNGRITLVLRHAAAGAELYSESALRAVLSPISGGPESKITSVALASSAGASAAVDATFAAPGGQPSTLRFELQLGQGFVKTEPLRRATHLRIEAPCRFAILPDFFAADMVVDATQLPVGAVELPSENFLMHMVGDGSAIVLAVWNQRQEDVKVELAGDGEQRAIRASEIPYGQKGGISIAVLEAPGIWHRHDLAKADADKVIDLGWKAPFAAQWRTDFRQSDELTDSWEMLAEKPDGTYARHDWFGQSDAYGTPDWMKPDRRRWTTVLGFFQYPCWIDKQGRGFLQPLKKPGNFQGPALIYPIARTSATPLSAFTFIDIVRDTLGVGPCEYVLDVEGQKKQSEGIPTCATRTKLDAIYAAKQQKQKSAEVRKAVDDVHAFMRHIRNRIESYVDFGHQTLAYLDQQKQRQPQLAKLISEMETILRHIDSCVERRAAGIHTREYADALVADFRSNVVDYDGPDALQRCKKLTAGFVEIGGNQDELVGECRLAVKILRQKAGLAMAADPRAAELCREIRRRTHEMLRNPASYEAPRH